MKIIILDSLTFGLNHIAEAASDLGVDIYLFTHNRSLYNYELNNDIKERITVVDVDTFNSNAVLKAAKTLGKIDGVINLTDTWCLPTIDLAEKLGLPCQGRKFINLVRNKSELRNHLYRNKLSKGPSLLIKENKIADAAELEKQPYPAIIKEVSGTGSRNVWLARDIQEAKNKISEIRKNFFQGELTVEPYFQGSLYSVETLTWEGETKVLAITSRKMSDEPLFREDALSLPVHFPTKQRKAIDSWIITVLESLDYTQGFAHTEFVITGSGMEVVEVNPRMGGAMLGEMLVRSFDTNFYKAHVEMALGMRPEVMDEMLPILKGCANYLVYAKETGIYNEFQPGKTFGSFPGSPEFYSTIYDGASIEYINEYRALVGIIFTEGETSEIAQINAYY